METNWIFITIVIVVAVSFVILLIWRNQKDRKDLMRKLIEEDKASVPEEHETEADQNED